MSHYKDPKIIIPHYDTPPGTIMSLQNREGMLTLEKQEDGGWEVVGFDPKLATKVSKFA